MIVGGWAGHTNDKDYLVWNFNEDGTFEFVYYADVMNDDTRNRSHGAYSVAGNKLTIKDKTVQETGIFTIQKLVKNKSLVFKNKYMKYELYPDHN